MTMLPYFFISICFEIQESTPYTLILVFVLVNQFNYPFFGGRLPLPLPDLPSVEEGPFFIGAPPLLVFCPIDSKWFNSQNGSASRKASLLSCKAKF